MTDTASTAGSQDFALFGPPSRHLADSIVPDYTDELARSLNDERAKARAVSCAETAERLWGEPKWITPKEWRWGARGSRSVNLEKNVWFDHEANEGGDTIRLVERELSISHEAATAWLLDAGDTSHENRTDAGNGVGAGGDVHDGTEPTSRDGDVCTVGSIARRWPNSTEQVSGQGGPAPGSSISVNLERRTSHLKFLGKEGQMRKLATLLLAGALGTGVGARALGVGPQEPGQVDRHDPLELPGRELGRAARDDFEKRYIWKKYEESGGNMSRTAEVLQVERSNLYRKMKGFGLIPARKGDTAGS
jgi:hypothetical protein